MSAPDLDLLVPLDVLLSEGSVARAAERLRLSPSAMSRTLARLRETTGDPLLVRAGRGLVPTPRALELRARVAQLVQDGTTVLRPSETFDLKTVSRTFTVRTSEGFVESFGSALLVRAAREAPGIRLRFLQKSTRDGAALRTDDVDLEIGTVAPNTSPELRVHGLFRDRLVGVIRPRHPLAKGRVTPARYAAAAHVAVSRGGMEKGRVDTALEKLGLEREITTMVSGFSAALTLARSTDLVATVPERYTAVLRTGMHQFSLPIEVPEITVSMLWHPRFDVDGTHRWLRSSVLTICAANQGLSTASLPRARSR